MVLKSRRKKENVKFVNGKESFEAKITGVNKYYGENFLENYLKTEHRKCASRN